MGMAERSAERRKRIVAHRAKDFADAERWDLEFWQSQTPQERLSAFVALRREWEIVKAARRRAARAKGSSVRGNR